MTARKKKKVKVKKQKKQIKLSFADHLNELRSRVYIIFIFFIIGSIVGYLLNDQILDILIKPLDQPIFYTSPAGGFEFVFQTSLFFGFLVSLPILVYQTIRFIEPALPTKCPNLIFKILLSSIILMLIGISFAYFVSLPAALYFLSRFSTDQIQSLISTQEYFTFVTRYLIGFGLIFQLPLVMFAINTIQKVKTKSLLSKERYLILTSVIFAGVLTPTPDIVNQLIMALPIILLYQFTIILLWLVNKKSA